MSPPRWAVWLLRCMAPPERVDDVVGDLEEVHRERLARSGRVVASTLTGLEAIDVARALAWGEIRHRFSVLDVRLALAMLVRYPGLTILGGFALSLAIWLGAGPEALSQVVRSALEMQPFGALPADG